jgi:hypothetical protein
MNKQWSLVAALGLLGVIGLCRADTGTGGTIQIDGKKATLTDYAKAFIGEDNVKVEMAPYKQGTHDGAILVFHGVESAWDGKAINHRIQSKGQGEMDYIAAYHGKDWHTLVVRKNDDGALIYQLYLPEIQDAISLAPSDGAAQLTTPQAIVQEYQQQKK